jgi:hypothetical protein
MVIGLGRRLGQHELPIAVRALDLVALPHFEINPRVPKRAATAVTGDAPLLYDNDFGGWCVHGYFDR